MKAELKEGHLVLEWGRADFITAPPTTALSLGQGHLQTCCATSLEPQFPDLPYCEVIWKYGDLTLRTVSPSETHVTHVQFSTLTDQMALYLDSTGCFCQAPKWQMTKSGL